MAKYTESEVTVKSSTRNSKYKTVENEKGSYQLSIFIPEKGRNKGVKIPMLVIDDSFYGLKISVREAWAVRRAVKGLRLFCQDYPLEGKQKPKVEIGKYIQRDYGDDVGSYVTTTWQKEGETESWAMWVASTEGKAVRFGVKKAHKILEMIQSVRAFCVDYPEAGDE